MSLLRVTLALVALGALVLACRALAGNVVVEAGDEATLGLGCIVIGAFVGGELCAAAKLPRLTGYLLAGIALGPEFARVFDASPRFVTAPAVSTLGLLDDVAIGIIAFLGGGELRWKELRHGLGTFGALLSGHLVGSALFAGTVVVLMPGWLGLGEFEAPAVWASAILLGVVAATASPATALAIRTESRAKGPVADSVLAVTVLVDVAIAVLLTLAVAGAAGVLGAGAAGGGIGHVVWEVVGSLVAGVVVGGLLVVLIGAVKQELAAVLLACAVGTMFLSSQYHLSGLLVCMVAGFVVENFSKHGPALVHTLEKSSLPLFAVFFAVAGARIDLQALWGAAGGLLLLCLARGLGAFLGTYGAGRAMSADPAVSRWTWTGLLGQAGLSLALANTIVASFPSIGTELSTVILGSVAINQIVGPILFGVALDRAGEVGAADAADAPHGVAPAGAHP